MLVISRNPQEEALRKVAALRIYTPHFRVDTDLRRAPREISVSWNPYTHAQTPVYWQQHSRHENAKRQSAADKILRR